MHAWTKKNRQYKHTGTGYMVWRMERREQDQLITGDDIFSDHQYERPWSLHL